MENCVRKSFIKWTENENRDSVVVEGILVWEENNEMVSENVLQKRFKRLSNITGNNHEIGRINLTEIEKKL